MYILLRTKSDTHITKDSHHRDVLIDSLETVSNAKFHAPNCSGVLFITVKSKDKYVLHASIILFPLECVCVCVCVV
jgi:hypothetical protein